MGGVVSFLFDGGKEFMKNKIVKQVLIMCMVASLMIDNPLVICANDDAKTSEETDIIDIAKKGAETSIYKDDKVLIAIDSAQYTLNASDIILSFTVKNMYPNILTLKIRDAKVDDIQSAFEWDTNDYKAGTSCSSNWYIMLEKLQETNATDFSQLSFTMEGTLNDGTELFEKKIVIAREAFKSIGDDTTSGSKVINNDEDSVSDVVEESKENESEQIETEAEFTDPIKRTKEELKPYIAKLGIDTKDYSLAESQEFWDGTSNIFVMGIDGNVDLGFTAKSGTIIKVVEWVSNDEISNEQFTEFISDLDELFDGEHTIGKNENTSSETYVWDDPDDSCIAYAWYNDGYANLYYYWQSPDPENESETEAKEKETDVPYEKEYCMDVMEAYEILKDSLKNPNSLVIYGVKLDGSNVMFDYGATNSFGGMVRNYAILQYGSKLEKVSDWLARITYEENGSKLDWDLIQQYYNELD